MIEVTSMTIWIAVRWTPSSAAAPVAGLRKRAKRAKG